MSRRYIPPFAATLQPSRLALGLLALCWLALCGALVPLAWWWRCLVAGGALLASLSYARVSGMLGGLNNFSVDARGACHLGGWRVAVLPDSVALPWIVYLRGRRADGQRLGLLVWRDAVPSATHRALRVYVQWCRTPAAALAEEESI